MSAKTVTDNGGTAREAVLRAMQEAAENAAGKKGVPKGPQGTKGIAILPNDTSWSSPDDKNKKKKWDDDDEDEGSETPSLHPRNLSYSSTSSRAPKGPAKRNKSSWPPSGGDEGEEEEEGEEDNNGDDDDSGSRHSHDGIETAIDHANLYDWLLEWTKEHGIPGVTPVGVLNTLCLDGTLDESPDQLDEQPQPCAVHSGKLGSGAKAFTDALRVRLDQWVCHRRCFR